jgi:hypothetical protein
VTDIRKTRTFETQLADVLADALGFSRKLILSRAGKDHSSEGGS